MSFMPPGCRDSRGTAGEKTIPILAITDDMSPSGMVDSIARPDGNTTGVSIFAAELDGKRQDILIQGCPASPHDGHCRFQRDRLIAASGIAGRGARTRRRAFNSFDRRALRRSRRASTRRRRRLLEALNILSSPSSMPIARLSCDASRRCECRPSLIFRKKRRRAVLSLTAHVSSNLSRALGPANRQAPARREACRSADRAADRVRVGDGPRNR